jgi:hypothetical protein
MKLFFSMFMLIALSVAATAQNLTLGVKGGGSFSQLKGDYTYQSSSYLDTPPVSSLTFGGFANYSLTSFLSVQTEINYLKQGFKFETAEGIVGGYTNGKATFNYLQIPILAQISYGSSLKLFANAGLSANFLISGGSFSYHVGGTQYPPVNNNYHLNIKSDFNKVTLGLVGSAGVSYDITSTIGILGEFRVGYDLTKSSKNKNIAITDIDLPSTDNSYISPVTYNDTHFLSYTVQGGVYFRFGK